MAQKTEKAFRSFIKGLVTEANELTFPDSASVDEENFVLSRDGTRLRRLGLDYEDNYALKNTGLNTSVLKSTRQSFYMWESPGGETSLSFGIIRVHDRLWFIDLLSDTPSKNFKNKGNHITISGLGSGNLEVTTINDVCILASKDINYPIKLSYNPSTDTVSQAQIKLQIRDLYGVHDGLSLDDRPANLSNTHKYNLRNQGWNPNIVNIKDGEGKDAIEYTKTKIGSYPSNADVWTLGKNSNPGSEDYEKYDPEILERNSTSKYQVARGTHIIDAFTRGASRQAESLVTGLPTDAENGNISTVASYAQRIFYSGIKSNVTGPDARSPNYSGYIFFSKVVISDDDLHKCYQEADPTDPGINDIIASDGGTIQLPDVTKIIKIVASRASLLVFAENGVWEVYGDTGGFIATSFQVSKISSNGVLNPDSIVEVNGNFVYWSKAGIYQLLVDQASGRFTAESLSLKTIQTLYLDIPENGKNFCKGFYDEQENTIRWLYNDSDNYNVGNYLNRYNKELVYDATLGAWYKHNISVDDASNPFIADYVKIPGYYIVSGGSREADEDSSEFTVGTKAVSAIMNRSSQFSFLTMVGTSFTISKYKHKSFKDWVTHTFYGVDYTSYLVTGWELFGDFFKRKQTPYVQFYFKRTEDGYEEVEETEVKAEPIPMATSEVPIGAIVMWSNTVIPTGWQICDGTNGTPDLRNRFIVGVGSSYTKGEIGGSADAVVVSHSHTGSVTVDTKTGLDGTLQFLNRTNNAQDISIVTTSSGSVTYNTNGPSYGLGYSGGEGSKSTTASFKLNHNHSGSVTVNSAGTSGTDKNLPPYYALYYIMKMSDTTVDPELPMPSPPLGTKLDLKNQSSCLVQAQWDWANSVNSGKWGKEFQAYKLLRPYIPSGVDDPFDYGDGVIVTKNKLRGSGKCLSLKITSESGKDMQLLGWGMPLTMSDTI